MKTENIVLEKSFKFALRVIKLHQFLSAKKEFVISKQLLKSGTSVVANLEEAMGGFSERDFLAKVSIAYKEARETRLWLRLLKDSGIISETRIASILQECEEIVRILAQIQITIRNRNR